MLRWSFALAAMVALGVVRIGAAVAGIEIVSESAAVDREAGKVRFNVVFDEAPDFWTVDEFGRVADSFQYEIDGDWNAPVGLPAEGLDAVVRGEEIRVADVLRIREAGLNIQPDPDPVAGGWGAVRAEVPFQLDGAELSFSADLSALGDDGDGYFAYRLFTTEFGLTISEVESRLLPSDEEPPPGPGPGPGPGPDPVPLPAPLHAAAATGVLLGAGWLVRRVASQVATRVRAK